MRPFCQILSLLVVCSGLAGGCADQRPPRSLGDTSSELDGDRRPDATLRDSSDDAPTDGGAKDGGDTEPDDDTEEEEEEWTHPEVEQCNCPDPFDRCYGTSCVRPDNCESDEDCREGYRCKPDKNLCVCSGHVDECEPQCDEHADCPSGTWCTARGRCRVESCKHNTQCPIGLWCLPAPDASVDRRCQFPGPKFAGTPCEKHRECRSTWCLRDSKTCAQRCNADSDCPGTQNRCASSGICFEREESYCSTSCSKGRCRDDKCLRSVCRRSVHCPEGDCYVIPRLSGIGKCRQQLGDGCRPDEFRFSRGDPYCRIYVQCNKNVEWRGCPDGYECNTIEDFPASPSFCSRRVD